MDRQHYLNVAESMTDRNYARVGKTNESTESIVQPARHSSLYELQTVYIEGNEQENM